ncbi:MAG: hypothetical protein ABIL62_07525, partial [Planctomycetota bacterium]
MPFPSEQKPWLFYRLGPAKEKELFKHRRNTYDGVVVPAHIASYYSKFCSEFIGSLGKPYFIDPLTYIFAYNPSQIKRFVKDKKTGKTIRNNFGKKKKGDVKRSYLKLVEVEYGGIIQKVVEQNRSINPKDLKDTSTNEKFVKQVVEFQRNRLSSVPEKYKKYEKYAKKSGKEITSSPPICLVSPYFPITTLDARGWHSTNVMLIKLTKEIADGIPVLAVILAETAVLAQNIKQISKDYSEAGADGFLLWPDGFSGDQDSAALRVVYDAVETLNEGGRPVILMYGDAFSLVLHYAGLAGFACGICYGERKLSAQDVDIEGLIPPRYYLRKLKKKVQIETEVRRIQIDQYPDLVCSCEICQRKPDPVNLDDTESREHFMLTRADEIKELREGLSQEQFASILRDAYQG